jgi:uncharacterized protein with FMN-binding domain
LSRKKLYNFPTFFIHYKEQKPKKTNTGGYYEFKNKNRCTSHEGNYYTVLFICLGILLVALLTFMFHPKNKETSSSKSTSYQPGIYTSQLTLGDKELEVEVTVDENHINSIRFSNLDDTVTTMYPLIQPTMEEIADQICQTQSLENISYSSDNPYTSQIIINAIDDALKKAVTTR